MGELLGEGVGPFATAMTRLTGARQADYEAFRKRVLSDRDAVYPVDGVHFSAWRTTGRVRW